MWLLVALVVYVVLAGLVLWFLVLNRASAEALGHSIVLLASLSPVLVSVLTLIKDERPSQRIEMRLVFDGEKKVFLYSSRSGAYHENYTPVFFGLENLPSEIQFEKDETTSVLNFVERGLLSTLFLELQRAWTKPQDLTSINSSSLAETFAHNKILSAPPLPEFREEDLSKGSLLWPPPLLSSSQGGIFGQMYIPKGSQLTPLPHTRANRRGFSISEHRFAEVRFDIIHRSLSLLQHEQWWLDAIGFPTPSKGKKYYQVRVEIEVSLQVNKFRRFSPKVELYRELYRSASNRLLDLHWPSLESRLRGEQQAEAIRKIKDRLFADRKS